MKKLLLLLTILLFIPFAEAVTLRPESIHPAYIVNDKSGTYSDCSNPPCSGESEFTSTQYTKVQSIDEDKVHNYITRTQLQGTGELNCIRCHTRYVFDVSAYSGYTQLIATFHGYVPTLEGEIKGKSWMWWYEDSVVGWCFYTGKTLPGDTQATKTMTKTIGDGNTYVDDGKVYLMARVYACQKYETGYVEADVYVDMVKLEVIYNVPIYSNPQTNTTLAGAKCNFTLDWTDVEGLSGYIFSTNSSGTWVNSSWVSFSGTSNTSWNVTTLNSTSGNEVNWCYYANDTDNNWNSSCDNPFSLTTEAMELYVFSNNQLGANSDLTLIDSKNATNVEDGYVASCSGKWNGENWYFIMQNSSDSGTIKYANVTFYNIYTNVDPNSDTFVIQCNKTDALPTDSGWATLWSGTSLWTSPANKTFNLTELCGVTSFDDINKTRFKITQTNTAGGEDTVTWYVDAINITYEKIVTDTEAPKYSNNQTNTTVAGQPANFTLDWTDDNGLSGHIFSTNNSGTWKNASWVSMEGTSNTSWNVTVLNDTVGSLVQWCYYANDTSNNWNGSSCDNPFELTTTSEAPTVTPIKLLIEVNKYIYQDMDNNDIYFLITHIEKIYFLQVMNSTGEIIIARKEDKDFLIEI